MRTIFLAIAAILFMANGVMAQTVGRYDLPPRILNEIHGIEADYEQAIRTVVPRYRLVRELEEFPPVKGRATVLALKLIDDAKLRTENPAFPPVIASLHDLRTGKPFANCKLPCLLKAPNVRATRVHVYRYGSQPLDHPAWFYDASDNPREIYLGFNEVEHQVERERCQAETLDLLKRHDTRDAEPCQRVAPLMPSTAEQSGHCMLRFNVDEYGATSDVQTTECTDPVFCKPSAAATRRFIYHPEIRYGELVFANGLETKMTYRLANEDGSIIPEPEGPMQPCIGIA